jgi:adenylate kinase
MKHQFSVISLIGKSGCGKGTQAKLLAEKTGFLIINTGDLLRKRARKKDVVGKIIAKTLRQGALIPTPIVFSLWMPILEREKNKSNGSGIIFDGNPRKKYEAQMLNEVFEMFQWHKRFYACHIRISDREAQNRLLKRHRADDTSASIKERLLYFHRQVEPMIAYYKQNKTLIEVNGEQSIKTVHGQIMVKLKGFLK